MEKLHKSEIVKLKKTHLLECQQMEKRFKLNKNANRSQNKTGVNKPQPVPKKIGKLLKITGEISQNGLKKKLFEYANTNKLHPVDKNGKQSRREIVPDDALRDIFGLQQGQIMEFKTISIKITELYKTKEPVHKAIAKVLNINGELSRYGIKKALLEYAEQHNLYDVGADGKKNKRAIIPNKELKKLFGMTNDQKLMTSAISKKIDDLYATKEYIAMVKKLNTKNAKNKQDIGESSDNEVDGSDNEDSNSREDDPDDASQHDDDSEHDDDASEHDDSEQDDSDDDDDNQDSDDDDDDDHDDDDHGDDDDDDDDDHYGRSLSRSGGMRTIPRQRLSDRRSLPSPLPLLPTPTTRPPPPPPPPTY